jgi:hypothetical protein
MSTSWYSISVSLRSDNSEIFFGYFSVDEANIIRQFYNAVNMGVNILTYTNDYGADYYFLNNTFTLGGANLTGIPALDAIYTATEWQLYFYTSRGGDVISYKDINGVWIDLRYFANFTITSVSDPSCFNEGTKILCLNNNFEEEYIPVEDLQKGDLVKSYKHGYRKIDLIGNNPMINNPENFCACMYKMEKTDDNGLTEDLILTGGHSILVDDLGSFKEENDKLFGSTTQMIDDKYLLLSAVSDKFVKLDNTNLYTYYHFILENNGNDDERFGVWANGVLVETTSKKQFINHVCYE